MQGYWDLVRPTYIENWEPSLYSLSIASIDIPLDDDAPKRLGSNIIEYGESFGPIQDIADIRAKVAAAVYKMPHGAFIRLGSRSPKDAWSMHEHGAKIAAGQDPLRFMLDCSERIYEDLSLAIQENYTPHIWVREWREIPRWAEFRCFMQDRKLVGISQYNYLNREEFPEIDAEYDMFGWCIQEFFKLFLKTTTMRDIIFDVYINVVNTSPHVRCGEVKLLEINPFFELTDPCLFAWNLELDRTFRFNKAGKIKSVPLSC